MHRRNQYLTVSLPSSDELRMLGVDHDRIAVVRNGADAIPAEVIPGGEDTRTAHPSVCVLSRLVPHKQIEDALTAVAALRTRIPGLHLTSSEVAGGNRTCVTSPPSWASRMP